MIPTNGRDLSRWYWEHHPGPVRTPAWGKDGAACKRWLEYNTAEKFMELAEKGWALKMNEALWGPSYLIQNAHLIEAAGEAPRQATPEEINANLAFVSEAREGLARLFKSGYKPQWASDLEDKKRVFGVK